MRVATPTPSVPIPTKESVRRELESEVKTVIMPWVSTNVYNNAKMTAAKKRLDKLHDLQALSSGKSPAVEQLYAELDAEVSSMERDRESDVKAWKAGDRNSFETMADVEEFYRNFLIGPSASGLPDKLHSIVAHVVSTVPDRSLETLG
jgi:hypothetical protein